MKLPPFNHAKARWDQYRRFYVRHGSKYEYEHDGHIVQFDTDELICTRQLLRPDKRGKINELNIEFLRPRDPGFLKYKFKDKHGTHILRTQIDKDQLLLLDHDTKRVVRMGTGDHWPDAVPETLRCYAWVYFAGPLQPPASGVQIRVTKRLQLTLDEKRDIEDLRAQCKAWDAMSDEQERYYEDTQVMEILPPHNRTTAPRRIFPHEYFRKIDSAVLRNVSKMTDLSKPQRLQLARCGYINRDVTTTQHPYLTFEVAR